eukprot:s4522_g3.t1
MTFRIPCQITCSKSQLLLFAFTASFQQLLGKTNICNVAQWIVSCYTEDAVQILMEFLTSRLVSVVLAVAFSCFNLLLDMFDMR